MTDELPFTEKTNGLVLLLIGVAAVFATATVFRPRAPSPFSSGSGYGTGYGSESIMVGAESKPGAAH